MEAAHLTKNLKQLSALTAGGKLTWAADGRAEWMQQKGQEEHEEREKQGALSNGCLHLQRLTHRNWNVARR